MLSEQAMGQGDVMYDTAALRVAGVAYTQQ
jgi:hypothetical protein